MRRIQSYGSSVNYLVKILQLKGEKIVVSSRPGNSVYFGSAAPSQKKFRSQKNKKEGSEKRRKREKKRKEKESEKRGERE